MSPQTPTSVTPSPRAAAQPRRHRAALLAALALTGALAGCVVLVSGPAQAAPLDAGIKVEEKATAADVGLPAYPGAQPYNEPGSDGQSAKINLWGWLTGVKVAVARYSTPDSVDQVARYYQSGLAQNGPVLDCSEGAARTVVPAAAAAAASGGKLTVKVSDKDDEPLTCESDRPKPGGRLYKAGTRKNLRVLTVEPLPAPARGSSFTLVRVELKGF